MHLRQRTRGEERVGGEGGVEDKNSERRDRVEHEHPSSLDKVSDSAPRASCLTVVLFIAPHVSDERGKRKEKRGCFSHKAF